MAKFTKGPTNSWYIDEAPVIFPWFSGKFTPMNREGDRNFGIVLTTEQADELRAAGYNVKTYQPKLQGTDQPDPSIPPKLWLKCKINFKSHRPPRVVLVTCVDTVCKRTPLNEENILLLDTADIEHVDVKFNPYDKEDTNTRTAYVENVYVKVNLDRYDAKYNDVPWDGEVPESLAEAHAGGAGPNED